MTVSKRRLDELVELRSEKWGGPKDPARPYIGLEHLAQGSPQLLGYLPSSESVSINCLFEKDDILFGKLRPNLRKSIRAPFAGYCSTDILVLRAREGTLPAFAGHVFQWEEVFNAAMATAAGTKMPRTSWNELRRFRIACPDATLQQADLSHILGTIDAAIEETSVAIAKLKQVRAGLIHDLLTCGLDDNGELRDPLKRPEQFQDSSVGRIPKTWNALPFGTYVTSWAVGPRFSGDLYDKQGTVATLRTTDMDDNGNINLETMPLAKISANEFRTHLLQPRDLVVSRSGTCGIAGVFYGHRLPVLPGAFLLRFRFDDRVDSEFIRLFLNSAHGRLRVLKEAEGGVQKNIRGTSVLLIIIPHPRREEQRAILQRMNQHNEAFEIEVSQVAKLVELKQGLMSDLLTGRVRVPETIKARICT